VNPNWHPSPLLEWERSVQAGVRGFKFYPADHAFDPITDPMMAVYQACEQQALPVVFHTGSTAQKDTEQRFIHPHEFLPIVESFPQLNIVLAHAGKPDWCAEALDMTERYPQVYVDTGLVSLSSLVALGLEQREARFKVLFGSDWPVCGSYEALLKRHADVQMSEVLRQQIFHDNAANLLADMEKKWVQPKSGVVSKFNAA
jgi:predicted TIM-barrel fold metal-dependent hydrolase